MERFEIGDHIVGLGFEQDCPLLFQLSIDGVKVSFVGMNYLGGMVHWNPASSLYSQVRAVSPIDVSEWDHKCLDIRYEKAHKKIASLGYAYYRDTYGFTESEFWELYETIGEKMSNLGWQNCTKCLYNGG